MFGHCGEGKKLELGNVTRNKSLGQKKGVKVGNIECWHVVVEGLERASHAG